MSGCDGCDPDAPGRHLPPPAGLDLGNGEAAVFGTAADMVAAADWLERHYPDDVTGPRSGPVFGPVLNMGAANALAAFRLYAGKVPPTSLLVLVYMATVSLDRDAEPSWWEGHEMLAIRVLGYPEPVGRAGKAAAERAITPLFRAGAITTTRHASGRAGRITTVRYRLWITEPASHGNRGKQRGQLPTETVGSNGQLPTETVSAPHGNRGTKEEEEELKQERDNTGTALELTDVEGAGAGSGQERVNGHAAAGDGYSDHVRQLIDEARARITRPVAS